MYGSRPDERLTSGAHRSLHRAAVRLVDLSVAGPASGAGHKATGVAGGIGARARFVWAKFPKFVLGYIAISAPATWGAPGSRDNGKRAVRSDSRSSPGVTRRSWQRSPSTRTSCTPGG
ncbi:hypothetical protein Airi01_078930 [Actinoallomurus iriomotensis]|uniref:Uncharacterized protein n=1 Tax=Actinoallomurus iriomotensis TaxID=478107 RepID=A0A9W6VVD5_9ACTN|nr:hypothetical protein Airi01_078930 [Actinoallomurus iriomotensis]